MLEKDSSNAHPVIIASSGIVQHRFTSPVHNYPVFFQFSAPTAWYSKQKGKFYSIAVLVLFWKYSEATGVSEYIRHSNSLQLLFVSVTEKKSLLRYLRGEIDTAPEIQVITKSLYDLIYNIYRASVT